MKDNCVIISTCSVSQIIQIYFKLVKIIDMQVKLPDLITHEPQSKWQGAFIVSFCFQEVLSNSKDLIHCSNSIRQRQRPGFHLKLHILELQCHGFTLKGKQNIQNSNDHAYPLSNNLVIISIIDDTEWMGHK